MLEFHPNDNAREGQPSVWIFSGRLVILPVIGVAAFVALFRILDSASVDWWLNIIISLMPFAGMALYVWLFVKDKAPSHGRDVLGLWVFRFKQWLYLCGVFDRPPQFWVRQGQLPAPGEFREESR